MASEEISQKGMADISLLEESEQHKKNVEKLEYMFREYFDPVKVGEEYDDALRSFDGVALRRFVPDRCFIKARDQLMAKASIDTVPS